MSQTPNSYLRVNLSLAWPLAVNALLTQAMIIIDTLLVSPLGEISLAAMGIAGTILSFFLGLQLALANGSQLAMGKAYGANDQSKLVRCFYYGLTINIVATLAFILTLSLSGNYLVSLLTDDAILADQVQNYLSISQYILLVNAITQTITALLNGQGNTKTALHSYLLEVPINIVLSYCLIFGVDGSAFGYEQFSFSGLGLEGAAFGSLFAVIIRLIYLSKYLKKQKQLSRQHETQLKDWNGLKAHFVEVLPIATNYLVLAIGNTIYLLLFAQLNIYSYVAITLIFPWLRIATQFIVAWAQANAITITQAMGKQQYGEINPIINSCIKVGMLMACCVSLALYGLSLSLSIIYPNIEPPTIMALASIMPLYVCLPLVRTYNTIAGNSLRAVGKSVGVLNVHFFTQWLVVLPLCALFVLVLELPVFWAFALLPIEELIKVIPFHLMLKNIKLPVSQVKKFKENSS
ncbi:MATE family efflux transporter [Paraglaciecola sp.]|uniref:MATE family efflux transporter n=1 Tax=Paraglaciecola sp. TaxID=1920173 RepID=UPI003EF455D3